MTLVDPPANAYLLRYTMQAAPLIKWLRTVDSEDDEDEEGDSD